MDEQEQNRTVQNTNRKAQQSADSHDLKQNESETAHPTDTPLADLESQEEYENRVRARKRRRSILGTLRFVAVLALVWVVIYVVTHFFYGFIVVDGESMNDTLIDGQVGIIQKFDQKKALHRGDIVVFYSDELSEYLIKRCVAVGGDTVSMTDGVLCVNGEVVDEDYIKEPMIQDMDIEEITLSPDTFFAMGDNRNNSCDSRDLGPISMESYTGKLILNLGDYGVTKKRAVYGFFVLFALLLFVGFFEDLRDKKKLESIPEAFREFEIEVDRSACTGEMTIGFRNPATRKLELMELVRNEREIREYCRKYAHEYRDVVRR